MLQGERSMAGDNKSIGRFMLDGIIPAPRGIPQIEVTFDIDANGILSVSAQDKGTGKEQRIVIQSGSGMDKADIERMVEEARQYEADDQQRRAEVDTRNQADSMVYQAEKLLNDNADKVPQDLRAEVQTKIDALRSASASGNVAEMQTALTELSAAMQKLGEVVYSQSGAPGPGGPGGEPPDDTGTVEGGVSGRYSKRLKSIRQGWTCRGEGRRVDVACPWEEIPERNPGGTPELQERGRQPLADAITPEALLWYN